jgi:hypothetical protein
MNLLEMDLQADMEAEMAIPVPEGAPPRSAVAVVAKVLTKEAKHNTFLKNAGLQPSSTVKLNKLIRVQHASVGNPKRKV